MLIWKNISKLLQRSTHQSDLTMLKKTNLLETISSPDDLRAYDSSRLHQIAKELRNFILSSVSSTGGHLSSNLGTVELAIALHYVFDTPHDRLIWDVGHQAYAHKIIGELDLFAPLMLICPRIITFVVAYLLKNNFPTAYHYLTLPDQLKRVPLVAPNCDIFYLN